MNLTHNVTDPERVLTTLERARARIELFAHWTQGATARDAGGRIVAPVDLRAVCWCPAGAVQVTAAIAEPANPGAAAELDAACLVELYNAVPFDARQAGPLSTIQALNDGPSWPSVSRRERFALVHELFDRTIRGLAARVEDDRRARRGLYSGEGGAS